MVEKNIQIAKRPVATPDPQKTAIEFRSSGLFRAGLLSLMIRSLTLGSKFILVLFLARFLSPEELGVWGLINISIAISLYFLGFDFYIFNTREILAYQESECAPMIRDQFVFHLLIYAAVLPLLLILFAAKFIAWQYVGWFYALLILEHVSQELARLLIALSRPVAANLVMFLRMGAWAYIVLAAAFYLKELRNLPSIWSGWIIGVAVSILVAGYSLRRLRWRKLGQVSINWGWIHRGLKVASPFLLGSMSFVIVQYIDRYFLQHFWGEALVGVYTFYFNIANVIHVFIFTGVAMIIYPRLIAAYQQGRFDEYRALMKKLSSGIIWGIAILTGLALFFIDPVLKLIDKQVFIQYRSVFVIMLAGVALLTASYIPHYSLYAKKFDKAIIFSAVAALGVALLANSLLVPRYGIQGAAYATLSSMSTLMIVKSAAALKLRHRKGR